MNRIYTPLPEVSDFSERLYLDVDSLGLPIGLDPGKIGLDIAATERAARLCDTSSLIIVGKHIDEDGVSIGGNIQPDGSLLGAIAKTSKATNHSIDNGGADTEFAKSISTKLALNSGLRKSRVNGVADLFNPVYQSRMLNQQLRRGLRGIAHENQLNFPKSGLWRGILAIGDIDLTLWFVDSAVNSPPDTFNSVKHMCFRGLVAGIGIQVANQKGKEAKPSVLWSVQLDRYAAACGYLATHRLIAPMPTAA